MEADLSTNFFGMNPQLANEAINANMKLLGSYLNLADGLKELGLSSREVNDSIEELRKTLNNAVSDNDAKKLVDEIGEIQKIQIADKLIKVKIVETEDVQKVIGKLQEADSKITKTANTTKKAGREQQEAWKESADGIGTSADRAVMAIDSVSGAFGGASTGFSGVVGDVIQLIKNPMTAAIAGAGVALIGVIQLGKKLWDEWNLSLEESITKAEFLKSVADSQKGNVESEGDKNTGLLARLREINKDGGITNNLEMIEATQIIDTLIEKLVKLGHVEDDLREKIKIQDGSILGLDFAEIQMELGAVESKIEASKKVVETASKLSSLALKNVSDFVFTEGGLLNPSNTADEESKRRIKNTEDIRDLRFQAQETTLMVIDDKMVQVARNKDTLDFERRWNSLMDEGNLQGVLDLIEERFSTVKTQEAQQGLKKLYETLKTLKQEQDELNSLVERGAKSENDYFAKLAKQTKQVEAEQKSISESKKKEWEEAKKKAEDSASHLTDEEQYQKQKGLVEGYQTEINKLNGELKQADTTVMEAKKKVDDLAKKFLDGEKVLMEQVRQAAEDYNGALKNRTTIENNVYDVLQKQLEAKTKLTQLEKKAQDYTAQRLRDNENNAELERYAADGEWDKYNEKKLQIQFEKSGLNLTDEQKQLIRESDEKNREQSVDIEILNGFKGLFYDVEKKLNPQQAEKNKLIRQYEKKLGGELSDAHIDSIDRFLSLKNELENIPKINLSEAQIKTNSLTSRGGWAGGAVTPDVNRVNQQIYGQTTNINTLLGRILTELANVGKI